MAIESLRHAMATSRISRAMDVPRSSTYYNRIERSVNRKPRVLESVETEIKRISGERTKYGYRRVWALLRNSGVHMNIKTVQRCDKHFREVCCVFPGSGNAQP